MEDKTFKHIKFKHYRKINKHGKITYDVGWALQLWKLKIRWNKQSNYTALSFEWGNYYLV